MPSDDEPKTTAEIDELWVEESTCNTHIRVLQHKYERSPSKLHQLTGPGAPCEHLLLGDRVVVGRSATADIVIESPELSRHHVVLERDGDSFKCTDLDSTHGLFLNGIRVYSCVLRPGDSIQIGRATFLYQGGI